MIQSRAFDTHALISGKTASRRHQLRSHPPHLSAFADRLDRGAIVTAP